MGDPVVIGGKKPHYSLVARIDQKRYVELSGLHKITYSVSVKKHLAADSIDRVLITVPPQP